MKKILKYGVTSIILIIFTYVLGLYIWRTYLEYYWNTETITLYQKNGIMRLCNSNNSLTPSWEITEENNILLEKAGALVKQGIPITVIGRGKIYKSPPEVYVIRITKLESGVNSKCEERLNGSE